MVPAATIVQLTRPAGNVICTGVLAVVKVALPSWPLVFCPHAYKRPVVVIAKLKEPPAAIMLQLVVAGPDTSTALDFVVNALIPTCPDVFCPHAYKRPAVLMPKLCDPPAATAVQLNPAVGPAT